MKLTYKDICLGDTQHFFHGILRTKLSFPDVGIGRGPEM